MVAAGIPEEMYWRLTPRELSALLEQVAARRKVESRDESLRAGLIAAEIRNTFAKPGSRAWQPADFLHQEPEIVSPDEARRRIAAWGIPSKGTPN